MLRWVLENPAKNNPNTLVDDLIEAQTVTLLKPIPHPMTHGYDQKRNHVWVILFIDMGNFPKLIFQQMKNRLLSFVQISLILSRQLVPFAQDQQADFLVLIQVIRIGADQFLKGLSGTEAFLLAFFYPLLQRPQEEVRMLDQ